LIAPHQFLFARLDLDASQLFLVKHSLTRVQHCVHLIVPCGLGRYRFARHPAAICGIYRRAFPREHWYPLLWTALTYRAARDN
jgi:hypothetical protein